MNVKSSKASRRAFGAVVRARRIELGMTQAELAELLDCTASMVTHIETGFRGFPVDRLPCLAKALRTTAPGLVASVDETSKNLLQAS